MAVKLTGSRRRCGEEGMTDRRERERQMTESNRQHSTRQCVKTSAAVSLLVLDSCCYTDVVQFLLASVLTHTTVSRDVSMHQFTALLLLPATQ